MLESLFQTELFRELLVLEKCLVKGQTGRKGVCYFMVAVLFQHVHIQGDISV